MKPFTLLIAAACFLQGSRAVRADDTYSLFLAKASLTVVKSTQGADFYDRETSRTLVTNDLINLALGRPLGTKVTEKLAVAVFFEGPGTVSAPKSKLVVYDSTATPKVVATVATLSELETQSIPQPRSANKGQGIGALQIVETTSGQDVTKNKLFGTTLRGAALAKATPSANAGELSAFTMASTGLAGPLHVLFTTMRSTDQMEFDGVATKGTLSTSKFVDVVTF